jgi:hypothetical protein
LWIAVAVIPLVGAALVVFRPGRARPRGLLLTGAFLYATAGCAVLLALAVGMAAALRAGGLGCPAVADPQRPRALLELGCTPGYDDSGLLVGLGVLIGLPLAVGCLAAARALLRSEGQLLFGLVASVAVGGAIQVALSAGPNDGQLRIAVVAGLIALPAAACLLLDSLRTTRVQPGGAARSRSSNLATPST